MEGIKESWCSYLGNYGDYSGISAAIRQEDRCQYA